MGCHRQELESKRPKVSSRLFCIVSISLEISTLMLSTHLFRGIVTKSGTAKEDRRRLPISQLSNRTFQEKSHATTLVLKTLENGQ